MKVTIDLEYEQIDAIMVNELKNQYNGLKEDLINRKNGAAPFGVFSSDKKKDIAKIKRYLKAFDKVLKWNMTHEEYKEWHSND